MPASAKVDARMKPSWTTFVAAAQGVLEAAGMYEPRPDTSELMALSGRAFHLAVDEACSPAGPSVYDWQTEHAAAFERLGVLAELHTAMPEAPLYDPARRRAVTRIKEALDRGVGVVLWGVDAPEFGIVNGYDDADGVFLTEGVGTWNTGASTPILYQNVGRSCDVPILHYAFPVERVPVDPDAAHRAALRGYVESMAEGRACPPGFTAGLGAYDVWAGALESGRYEPFGVRFVTAVTADAKKHAAEYLGRLATGWRGLPHLDEVAAAARENLAVLAAACDALGMGGPGGHEGAVRLGEPVTPEQARALVPILREARRVEERQLALARRALAG